MEPENTQGPAEAEVKRPAKTTYYDRFPSQPRPTSNIVHVFWAVANDFRRISLGERRNVVYPAKRAGLMDAAPPDEHGVRLNKQGETSRTGFVLTEEGERYYREHIVPILPEEFASHSPCMPIRKARKAEVEPADLKAEATETAVEAEATAK